MPLTTLNFSSASSFPTGSIVKAETKVISAFGDTAAKVQVVIMTLWN